jgi:YfiR/HmsC-like
MRILFLHRHSVIFLAICLACGIVLTLIPFGHATDAKQTDANALRAAFLINFVRLTLWPQEQNGNIEETLNFCIVQEPKLSSWFSNLGTPQIRGHSIRTQSIDAPSNLSSCHLVFVGDVSEPKLKQILALTHDLPILTVGFQSNFISSGGIIQLFEMQEHLKFNLNLHAAQQVNLQLSSQLLKSVDSIVMLEED